MNQTNSIKTGSYGIRTETETWGSNTDTQLTASLCETEFAIVEFQKQNEVLLQELNNLEVFPRCANRSGAEAKLDSNGAKSKLGISDSVISDLFEENKEVKQQLDKATSKVESLQSE